MKYIMVDIEANGACPAIYSMIEIGAVVVEPRLDRTFFGRLRPIGKKVNLKALDAIGIKAEDTLNYPQAMQTMNEFKNWLNDLKEDRLMFVSDNNGFDWQFVNYYFYYYYDYNPFGHSSTNLGSLYKGLVKDNFKSFKHLRKTKHSHNALDDAMGNAQAMLEMKKLGLKI